MFFWGIVRDGVFLCGPISKIPNISCPRTVYRHLSVGKGI
jgi:hypothetical protein